MPRFDNIRWDLPQAAGTKKIEKWDYVQLALLMDVRDELQRLNALFRCENFMRIPRELREIRLILGRDQRRKKKEKGPK